MTNLFTCLSKKSLSNGNGSGMDRDCIGDESAISKKLFASILFLLLLFGVGNVWGTTATFTFNTAAGLTELGITKPSSDGSGTNLSTSANYVRGNITMTVTHGSTNTRIWRTGGKNPGILDLRVYTSGGSLTFTAASGYSISGISITGSGLANFSANKGTYSTGSWSGTATSVTFTASGTVQINTITVTYSSSCTDISPSVTYTATTLYKGATASVSNITGNTGSASVSYSSSNSTVASVNSSTGVVTAGQAGTATITASFAATGGYCAKDVEITFTVRYQVKWSVNSNDAYTTGSPTTYIGTHNTKVSTLPTAPGKALCDNSKVFVGWTNAEYSHASSAPATLFTTVAGSPAITNNTTFYAVFATASAGDDVVDVINNSVTSSKLGGSTTSTWVSAWETSALTSGAKYKIYSMGINGASTYALQWNSSGYLYCSSAPSAGLKLKSITASTLSDTKSINLYGSTSKYSAAASSTSLGSLSATTSGATYNLTSAQLANNYTCVGINGAASSTQIKSISITYSSISYSNYTTSCCTELGSINGSFFLIHLSGIILAHFELTNKLNNRGCLFLVIYIMSMFACRCFQCPAGTILSCHSAYSVVRCWGCI